MLEIVPKKNIGSEYVVCINKKSDRSVVMIKNTSFNRLAAIS